MPVAKGPLSQVQELLPKLNPSELAQVAALVQVRMGATAEPVGARDDWLLEGIYTELRTRGLFQGRLPIEQLKKTAPNYERDSRKLQEHFAPVLADLNAVQCAAFWRVAAGALAEYLLHTAPIGPRRLLGNVHRIPEAFEASFPGYLASGLVPMVVPHG